MMTNYRNKGTEMHANCRNFAGTDKKLTNPSIEKEVTAIIQAERRWSHYLCRRKFILITNQRSVTFMFDPTKRSIIKNAKIEQWRAEMGAFSYVVHRPGKLNVAPDPVSRICGSILNDNFQLDLRNIHVTLGHPGITRLNHFVKSKNLPYSTQDVKEICRNCKICAELKPRFFRKEEEALIETTQPCQRLRIDLKRPVRGKNSYILFAVDEYSR